MKILYLIDSYQHNGGATLAMQSLSKAIGKLDNNFVRIFCRRVLPESDQYLYEDIIVGNGHYLLDYYLENHFEVIHWFKTGRTQIFRELCSELKKRHLLIPIVTTVCQKPSYRDFLLTSYEIKYSCRIVLIDKASYEDPYCNGLNGKKLIYFGTNFRCDEKLKDNEVKNENIIFGRGSSANKWPKNMIDNFDKIEIENKEFHVIGGDGRRNWLHKVISKNDRKDIVLYPSLSFDKWIEELRKIDIFFYQLPLDSYSSIDGTMQQAMMLQIPVIYYGPDAPKELIEHGISGFIAASEDEMKVYAKLLAEDESLRKRIGSNAKDRIIKEFSFGLTVELYSQLYQSLSEPHELNKVAVSYKMIWLYRKIKYFIYRMLTIPFKIWERIG